MPFVDTLLNYRKRLLDLSLRNPLVSFKVRPRYTIEITTPFADAYQLIVEEDTAVTLRPALEDQLFAPTLSGEEKFLATSHKPEDLERRCSKTRREATALERDSGINYLHAMFGQLEWYESDDAQKPVFAPLVLVPVILEKAGRDQRGGRFSVSYDGSEVILNPCIREKVENNFGLSFPKLKMPDFEGPADEVDNYPAAEAVTAFLDEIERLVSVHPRWKVHRKASISFLSFAKYRMYLDLDAEQWPTDRAIDANSLVRTVFGDIAEEVSSSAMFPSEDTIEKEVSSDELPLVVRADSSQHAAIAAAVSGANLVIQGPPGTGKSQTITNIIAALLHAGKTVLFVAEKEAALGVVRDNLIEVGLGDFVLDLYDMKGQRKIYESFAKRMGMSSSDGTNLVSARRDWQDSRAKLNAYVAAVKESVGPEGEKLPVLVGKIQKLHAEGVEAPMGLHPEGTIGENFRQRNQFLVGCEGSLRADLFDQTHPWNAHDAQQLGPGGENEVDAYLRLIRSDLQRIEDSYRRLGELLGVTREGNLREGLSLTPDVLAVFTLKSDVVWELVAGLAVPTADPTLDAALTTFGTLNSRLASVGQRVSAAERGALTPDLLSALGQLPASVLARPATAISLPAVQDLAKELPALQELLQEGQALGLSVPPTVDGAVALRDQLVVVAAAPAGIATDITDSLFQSDDRTVLAEAREAAKRLSDRRQQLGEIFLVNGALPAVQQVQSVRQQLAVHGASTLKRWFGSDYKTAKNAALCWLAKPTEYEYPSIVTALDSFESWLSDVEKFNAHARYRAALGKLFCGVETDWDHAARVLAWCQTAVTVGLDCATAKPVLGSPALRSAAGLAQRLSAHLDRISPAYAGLKETGLFPEDDKKVPVAESGQRTSDWLRWLTYWIAPLQTAALGQRVTLAELKKGLEDWNEVDAQAAAFASDPALQKLLGSHFHGYESDWHRIRATRDWIASMRAAVLHKDYVEGLLKSTDAEVWKRSLANLGEVYAAVSAISKTLGKVSDHLPSLEATSLDFTAGQFLQKVEAMLSRLEMLPRWATLCRWRQVADKLGLIAFFDAMTVGEVKPEQLAKVYRLVEYDRSVKAFIRSRPILQDFVPEIHDGCRDLFRSQDEKLLELHRIETARAIMSRPVPKGQSNGPIRSLTDAALIRHQTILRKRQLPMRQLIERAGAAARAYKPCFMMRPLTVAQFIPPSSEPFDVVIMDEASQIMPEDALGAIARGRQLIVVGDQKQLPPSNFFRISSDDEPTEEEEDQENAMDLADSILASAEVAFRSQCSLKWHYRSLHESLINFSNLEFYGNNLLVFPSSDPSAMGIRHRYIADGTFAKRNLAEAHAVVAAIGEHFRNTPKLSLAVITFNLSQKELIVDLLDEALRSDAVLREAYEKASEGKEPFLVRNLENIQGEQRDVIFISCTYGPDVVGGAVAQRFGPVNSKGGGRRLNVMFTRAKHRMDIFSSMRSDQVVAEPGEETGRGYLRRFLQYSETGRLEQPVSIDPNAKPDSEFEESVADFIRQHGYVVRPQVGVVGFFIDMGVQHPNDLGRFLLGVECDGATYHSSKTARDRDRLREEVLRGRGWKLHRIWSTDWFRNRRNAQDRLLAALKAASPASNGHHVSGSVLAS